MHVHISFAHALLTFLEMLIAWIPLKIISANFVGRSNLADALYGVL